MKKLLLIATLSIAVSSEKHLNAMDKPQVSTHPNKARALFFRQPRLIHIKNQKLTPISETPIQQIPIPQTATCLGQAGLLSLGEKQDLQSRKNFLQHEDNYELIALGKKELEYIKHILTLNDLFYYKNNTIYDFSTSLSNINMLSSEKISCPIGSNAFNSMIKQPKFLKQIDEFKSSSYEGIDQELLIHICREITTNNRFSNAYMLTTLHKN